MAIEDETDSLIPKSETTDEAEPLGGFFFLGFVANLAFNYLLQEVKFFNDVFGPQFGRWAPTFFSGSTFLGQILMLFFGSMIPYGVRIVGSCLVLSGTIIAIPLMAWFHMTAHINIVYANIVVMGLMTAVVNSSGFSLTSLCSAKIRIHYTVGTCLAGVTAWPCMIMVGLVLRKIFRMSSERLDPNVPNKAEVLTCVIVLGSATILYLVAAVYYMVGLSSAQATRQAIGTLEEKKRKSADQKVDWYGFWSTVLAVLPLAAAAWNVMFTTFLVLPSQMVEWKATYNYRIKIANFYEEFVLFWFNVCDATGRGISLYFFELLPVHVIAGSCARWILLPFFFLSTAKILFFHNDIFRLVLQGSFGLSYGILTTWAFALAPVQPGVKSENADIAGSLMSFIVVFGIMVGAGIAGPVAAGIDSTLNFRPYDAIKTSTGFAMNEIIH
jgi:hypothetical protein